MEFKGTKGKWFIWREELIVTDYDTQEDVVCIKPTLKNTSYWKANALLISKAPEMLKEHINDLEILEKVSKQLEELGGYLWDDILERIAQKKELIKEATEI